MRTTKQIYRGLPQIHLGKYQNRKDYYYSHSLLPLFPSSMKEKYSSFLQIVVFRSMLDTPYVFQL